MLGSASAATSGTMRCVTSLFFRLSGGAEACQLGREKYREKPPPVPLPFVCPGALFQTTDIPLLFVVPPHPTTLGHEEGASTFAGSSPPSWESLSPEAAKTIIPCAVALCAAASISSR